MHAQRPASRTLLDGVLSPTECAELIFVLRATAASGYRPHVASATIADVTAAAPALLPALVRARQRIWDAAEDAFDAWGELHVEFTGLLSWGPGASIGWHHDANRDYLSQRHYSAVLYLNDHGVDFTGGEFQFQCPERVPASSDGQAKGIDGDGANGVPLSVLPRRGRLLLYGADEGNVHCVAPVKAGERCTLTLWLTRDAAFREDSKVRDFT